MHTKQPNLTKLSFNFMEPDKMFNFFLLIWWNVLQGIALHTATRWSSPRWIRTTTRTWTRVQLTGKLPAGSTNVSTPTQMVSIQTRRKNPGKTSSGTTGKTLTLHWRQFSSWFVLERDLWETCLCTVPTF